MSNLYLIQFMKLKIAKFERFLHFVGRIRSLQSYRKRGSKEPIISNNKNIKNMATIF